jgi:hypothetical protein
MRELCLRDRIRVFFHRVKHCKRCGILYSGKGLKHSCYISKDLKSIEGHFWI